MTTRFRLPRLLEKRQGFSIIELMTVVVVTAIMLLASFAVFKNFRERTSVKVAARDVTNIMRLARQKAVIEREDYLAVYDCNNETIWVQSYSTYITSGKNPDSGTEQTLPDKAIIARVKAGPGGQPSNPGTPDPVPADTDTGTAYHKFSPKSTVTSGSVWLKDEGLKNFYRVTTISTTARAKIYSSW